MKTILELATFHEHINKQPELALEVSTKAISFILGPETGNQPDVIATWEHRVRRLSAKLAK